MHKCCYDKGKRVAETLMMEYHRNHNVDIRIGFIRKPSNRTRKLKNYK